MHVVTDEHGNVIHSHHTHSHTHTIEHTHEHVHMEGHEEEHEHTHEHGHEHGHAHDHAEGHCHSEGCKSCAGCSDADAETLALVTYMLDHNRHHAMELADMAKKLREQGKDAAAEQIDRAVSDFENGNLRLSVALSLLKA